MRVRQGWCWSGQYGGMLMLWWGGCCGAEPDWETSREQCQALEAVGGGNQAGRWLLRGSPRCQ